MTTTIYASDNQAQATFGSDVADGTLTLQTGAYGAKVDAIYLDASGNATVAGNLTVTGKIGQSAVHSMVRVNSTSSAYGSTNTKILRITNVITNQGTDITYADSATLGTSFTINTDGVYSMSLSAAFLGAANCGISKNSTQLTTDITAITLADIVAKVTSSANNYAVCAANTMYLTAGDVIRPHTGGDATHGTNLPIFTITRVA